MCTKISLCASSLGTSMASVLPRKNENLKTSSKRATRTSSSCRKSRQLQTNSQMTCLTHYHISPTTILLSDLAMLGQVYGCMRELLRNIMYRFSRVFHETRMPMRDVSCMSSSRKKSEVSTKQMLISQILSIFLGYISRTGANQNRRGNKNSSSIASLPSILTHSAMQDIMSSGEGISTVHIMQSILLDPKKMMEKSGFTHSSVRGSTIAKKTVGMIYGEKKTPPRLRYTHGGIL